MLSDEIVLRRIRDDDYTHKAGSEKGSIHAKAFVNDWGESKRERTNSHSVSREKYTSASELRDLADKPKRYGVAALAVADYETEGQRVDHTPTVVDRGHCDAVGEKTARVKERLREKAVIVIPPPESRKPPR